MTVSCFICYHVFDIMLSFAFDLLFTVFFTTVKTLPWTARSKECYWLVGVFENRVVKKNTFKVPESCSRRSDSLEWCKVEKARTNREGTGESASLALSLSPIPPPPCFFFFFLLRFIFRAVSNYLNAWNTPLSMALRVTFNGPHKLPIETGCTFLWRVYCLVRIRPWRARQPSLLSVPAVCVWCFLSFFFGLIIGFWSLASLLSVCQLFISITSLFQVLTPRGAQSGNSCR